MQKLKAGSDPGLFLLSFRGVRSANPESMALQVMTPDGFRAWPCGPSRNDGEGDPCASLPLPHQIVDHTLHMRKPGFPPALLGKIDLRIARQRVEIGAVEIG